MIGEIKTKPFVFILIEAVDEMQCEEDINGDNLIRMISICRPRL